MIDLLPAVSAVELNVPCRDQSLQTLEPAGQSIKALEVLASRDIGQSFLFSADVQQSDSSNGRCIKARAMRKVRSEENDVCPVHSGAHVGKAIPSVTLTIRVNLSTDWIRRDKRLAKRLFDDECWPNHTAVQLRFRSFPSTRGEGIAAAWRLHDVRRAGDGSGEAEPLRISMKRKRKSSDSTKHLRVAHLSFTFTPMCWLVLPIATRLR